MGQQVFHLRHLNIGPPLGIAIEQFGNDIFAQLFNMPIGVGIHQSRPGIEGSLRGEGNPIGAFLGEFASVIGFIQTRKHTLQIRRGGDLLFGEFKFGRAFILPENHCRHSQKQ